MLLDKNRAKHYPSEKKKDSTSLSSKFNSNGGTGSIPKGSTNSASMRSSKLSVELVTLPRSLKIQSYHFLLGVHITAVSLVLILTFLILLEFFGGSIIGSPILCIDQPEKKRKKERGRG